MTQSEISLKEKKAELIYSIYPRDCKRDIEICCGWEGFLSPKADQALAVGITLWGKNTETKKDPRYDDKYYDTKVYGYVLPDGEKSTKTWRNPDEAMAFGILSGQYFFEKPGEPILQKSPYMSTQICFEDLMREDGAKNNDTIQLCCPSCGEILIYGDADGTVYRSWHTEYPEIKKLDAGESIEPSCFDAQSYCGKCYYPLGTDWHFEVLHKAKQGITLDYP